MDGSALALGGSSYVCLGSKDLISVPSSRWLDIGFRGLQYPSLCRVLGFDIYLLGLQVQELGVVSIFASMTKAAKDEGTNTPPIIKCECTSRHASLPFTTVQSPPNNIK